MDNEGNLIGIKLSKDGAPYTGGGSVSANVIRSDGATISVIGSISGSNASVILPQDAYLIPGAITIIIKITDADIVTTIGAFIAYVYQSSTDTIIDPGTIIPSVETLIEAIEEAVASIPADYSSLWESLAPTFSTSVPYTAGQYVTYNGTLYKFVIDHNSGAWDQSQVASADIGSNLSALADNLEKSYNLVDFIATVSDGKVLNPGTGEVEDYADTNYKVSDMIDISGYDYVYIHTQMRYSNAVYVFYTEQGNYIEGKTLGSGSTLSFFYQFVKRPLNAKYLRYALLYTGYAQGVDGIRAKSVELNSIGYENLKQRLQNVFPFAEIQLNFSIEATGIDGSGNLVSYSGASVTDYIPCDDICAIRYTGETYFLYKALAFYDENHNIITPYPESGSSSVQITDTLIIVPENAYYMVFADYTLQTGHNKPTAAILSTIKSSGNVSPLYNKKVVVIGDSITERNSTARTNWVGWMQEETRCRIQNLGISGTGFHQNQPYINRISNIDSDADIIGVAISFNDIGHGMDIGTPTDTGDTTLCGWAYQFFTELQEQFPATPIICYSQGPWAAYHLGGQFASGGLFITNVKTICNNLGIPVYDGLYFNGSALRPWIADNQEVYYKNETTGVLDDTHPNSTGHKIIARYLIPKFDETICNIVE